MGETHVAQGFVEKHALIRVVEIKGLEVLNDWDVQEGEEGEQEEQHDDQLVVRADSRAQLLQRVVFKVDFASWPLFLEPFQTCRVDIGPYFAFQLDCLFHLLLQVNGSVSRLSGILRLLGPALVEEGDDEVEDGEDLSEGCLSEGVHLGHDLVIQELVVS